MTPPPPFYADWTFWSWVVALGALVLSQFPPLRALFRKPRLEIIAHTKIWVTHSIGYPYVDLFLSIRNSGGRPAPVAAIKIDVSRDGSLIASLPGQGYFESLNDKSALMMVPFRISADGEWNHAVKFYGNLARLEERHLRQIVSSLRTDITHKVEAVKAAGAPQVLQIADPALVVPLRQLFESKFVWLPGEYESVVSIDVEGQPSAVNRFRFTLYESDTADLRAHTEDYTFGGGVYFGGENRTSVWATVVRQ